MTDQGNIEALLSQLAENDDFRAEFEADPIATLNAYGIDASSSDLPPNGVCLPSKSEVASDLSVFNAQLEHTKGVIWFSA